ncbi:DUF1330 domain-containing protein [Alteromonas sp. ASW11-36]|uniref:DUF1330 domain-containing protein n=1 Tax=Alteromonas arenosi TaxID=3055817 RepID=A0ABT7SXL7_9ALTE|nr:DUF1330 domain-containing protein [Alteromonas sp. ASW11-36]MDM7860282.1 DUF1330 domain-containing protein [Alteromonas sp. ASW11-36]
MFVTQSKYTLKQLLNINLIAAILILSTMSLGVFANTQHWAVDIKPGQVVQLIAPVTSPETLPLRRQYYRDAIPLAEQYGFTNHGQLVVERTILGNFKPPTIIIGSWPSPMAISAFEQEPRWPELKRNRSAAWQDIRLYNGEVDQPQNMSFSADKSYTVAFAWVNTERPDDYYQYLDSVEPLLTEIGARFMFKIRHPKIESDQPNTPAPDQITFVEWPDAGALARLRAMPKYQEIVALLNQGVTQLDLHVIRPKAFAE